jgi:hypothetical protein
MSPEQAVADPQTSTDIPPQTDDSTVTPDVVDAPVTEQVTTTHADDTVDAPVGEGDAPASDDAVDDFEAQLQAARAEAADAARSEERANHEKEMDRRIEVERNNATRKQEAKMRREAGTNQAVQATVQQVIQHIADNGGDVDQAVTQALSTVVNNNRRNSLRQVLEDLPKSLLTEFDVPVAVREEALELQDAQDFDGYVRVLINGAVQAEHGKRVEALQVDSVPRSSAFWSDLKLENVPKDAPLWTELQAWKANELSAAGVERGTKVEPASLTTAGGGTAPNATVTHDLNTLVGLTRAHLDGTISTEEFESKWKLVSANR